MKKRILPILFSILVLLSSVCTGEEPNTPISDTAFKVKNLLGGIAMFIKGEKDTQAFIDSDLTDVPAFEWYVITLSQRGSFSFSSCYESLTQSFKNTSERASVTRQKYALALLAADLDLAPVADEIDRTIGAQGIMSWVYGLHLIHNGYVSFSHTEEEIIDTILSFQISDGGWALSGSVGNVDVTAMTVQALAPHRKNASVQAAIDRAVSFLALLQDPDGGYKSYGVLNPESTSQVITALTACGIDPFMDERFMTGDKTLLDALSVFVLDDGTLSHTLGGASSAMATVQAFYALTSYERLMDGKSALYEFDKNSESIVQSENDDGFKPGYKVIASAVIMFSAVSFSLVFFFLKKRNRKNFFFIFLLSALLIAAVFLTDFESADDYYKDVSKDKKNVIGSVTLEIRTDTLTGKSDKDHIPKDGTLLSKTSFPLSEGDSVYDILVEACKANKIHMEKTGAEGMIYISGIGYIYEFDFGDLSGWKYYVNDVSPSVGCDQYFLSDGDTIEWLYTLELGNDLK